MELINDYMEAVEKALTMFEKTFGRRDLIKAWREGTIPQTGELSGGVEYQMHGIGCWVNLPEGEVDFDFAYSNHVGFDTWRLWSYAKHSQNRYPDYQNQADIERALADASAAGVIEPFENYPRLLRLTEMKSA
ncbi:MULTISPECIES: DUF6896 domain-containing protein [unclassified Sphingopyxis]|uniref:DUF6896 domain-containing protein n=1 Tax=unclassified Sphingopyxis TaxID=2614943 RepID=UPI0012E3B1AB|nr:MULTISPECIES: hypothetical protein [unclassified Sphingopyxis]